MKEHRNWNINNFLGNGYSPAVIPQGVISSELPFSGKQIINIPSIGFPGTQICKDGTTRTTWGQMFEVFNYGTPGIFVHCYKLPQSEEDYREKLFGSRRPVWLTIENKSLANSTGTYQADVPSLDELVTSRLDIQNSIKEQIINPDNAILIGYNQTPRMTQIADALGIKYAGNPQFAMWAGGKIGLQEFLEKYGLPKLHTVTVFNQDDILSGLEYLSGIGYESFVVKVNHSTGGLGHKVTRIIDARKLIQHGNIKEILPAAYNENEGAVLQGWIDKQMQSGLSSLDLYIDDANKTTCLYYKTKLDTDADNPLIDAGYTPPDQSEYEELSGIVEKIKDSYSAEHATGPHCINFLHVTDDCAKRLGLPSGVPFIHDENTRFGVGVVARQWFKELTTQSTDDRGWLYKPLTIKESYKFADVLAILDKNDLLIKSTGLDADGIFVYEGINLDSGINKISAIAISKQKDLVDALAKMELASDQLK